MKNIITIILSALFITATAGLSLAKEKREGFPGRGQGAIHSNAPSTGTQMRGKERAMEVGRGEKRGLYHREAPAHRPKDRPFEREHKAKQHRQ